MIVHPVFLFPTVCIESIPFYLKKENRNEIIGLVKAAVTTRQAADFYGLQVDRNGMTCCPFHPDRHPSMKVDERYYCFGCHETGDVIDFVSKLFGLTLYEAAQKIAADFGLDPNSPCAPAVSVQAAQRKLEEEQRKKELLCIRILTDYESALKERLNRFAPSGPDDEWDPRFADACHALPQVTGLIESMYSGDAQERMETEYMLSEDGTLGRIQAWLKKENANKESDSKEVTTYAEGKRKAA